MERSSSQPVDPELTAAITQRLQNALANGSWQAYEGPAGKELGAAIALQFQRKAVQLVSSGTIAVELALRGVGVRAGDEVILAGYDFPGNFRAIEAIGAIPVLVDVAPHSWSLDASAARAAIGPQTRALLASHLHGSFADVETLSALAKEHSIALVEDACQAPGALFRGKPTGSWGDASVLSFGGSKLLTAGRGGAVLTDDPQIEQRLKIANDRGNLAYPLSELQALVLLPQIERLNQQHQRRAARVAAIHAALRDLSIDCGANDDPSEQSRSTLNPSANSSAWYKLPLRMPSSEARDRLIAHLHALGIESGEGFRGFWKRSAKRCRVVGALTHSQQASETTVLIGHSQFTLEEACQRLIQALRTALSS